MKYIYRFKLITEYTPLQKFNRDEDDQAIPNGWSTSGRMSYLYGVEVTRSFYDRVNKKHGSNIEPSDFKDFDSVRSKHSHSWLISPEDLIRVAVIGGEVKHKTTSSQDLELSLLLVDVR